MLLHHELVHTGISSFPCYWVLSYNHISSQMSGYMHHAVCAVVCCALETWMHNFMPVVAVARHSNNVETGVVTTYDKLTKIYSASSLYCHVTPNSLQHCTFNVQICFVCMTVRKVVQCSLWTVPGCIRTTTAFYETLTGKIPLRQIFLRTII